ncbi:alpha-2-macroglobulin family protein [Roseobacteraceae bacterium S113]
MTATVNGYLRSSSDAQAVAALLDMSSALERVGRGRDMIPTLRLAASLQERPDVAVALERAVAKHGFRVLDTLVESNSAEPRICIQFSERLDRRADYVPFVRIDGGEPILSAQDAQLCIAGLSHGARYQVALREGLPAANGERLARDMSLAQYVRDRTPSVRFGGRAYVLPKTPGTGLPVTTVNAESIALTLHRIDDRNMLRAVQDDLFGRNLDRWNTAYVESTVGEEIWSGAADISSVLNRDVTTRLPLDEVLSDQSPGLYALSAALTEDEDAARATQWFVLTDIGLTALTGADGLRILSNRLTDATPKDAVKVSLLSQSNRVLAEAQTDQAGQVHFDAALTRGSGGAAPAMVIARHGDDMSFLSLTDAAFDLSDRGIEGRAAPGPIDAYLTTDRGAYRPGDRIYATALLRNGRAEAVSDVPVTFVLRRPDGVEAWRDVSNTGLAGGHAISVATPVGAPRGTWTLAAYSDPNEEALAQTRILVEDFVPERIDVHPTLAEGPLVPGDATPLQVQVDYLFGAPGADIAVETQVRVSSTRTLDGWPGFSFGPHDAPFNSQSRYLPSRRTDASGAVTLPLDLPALADNGMPHRAEVIVSATEGSARPVERSLTRPIESATPLLGLKPEFDGVAPEGGEVSFQAIALQGGVPGDIAVSWELNKLDTRYEWYQLRGRWEWEATTRRTRVAGGTGVTGDAPITLTAPVAWGEYELVIRTAEGTFVEASQTFWAGWYAPADRLSTPDTLDVALDADAYAPGDTAEVMIEARHAGLARIAVLSDRLIALDTIEIEPGTTRHKMPVTQDWGTGAYVTVQLLRSTDADRFAPGRALGLAHAAISPGARALDVAIAAPEVMRPRETFAPEVTIAGLTPGSRAFVTLTATDLGILNVTGHMPPDPSDHFFGKRRLGVDIRDLYGRLINGTDGAMGRLRQGGDSARGIDQMAPPPAEDLVAWASGIVEVDAAGTAKLAIDVPDFNGTLRLSAMAWTADGVGQAHRDVIVRDPVVISTALPRFLAPGDESRLRIELTHVEGPTGTMPVQVSAPGLGAQVLQDVELKQGGSTAINVPLQATGLGDQTIEVALTLPSGDVLTKTMPLGVRANDPSVARTQRLSLAPGETLQLDSNVFGGLRPDGAEVLLSAGAMAQFDVPRLLSDLERYPYGCTEQLTSRTLPLLYLSQVSDALSLTKGAQIATRIDQVITQVLSRQSGNGSFGLWRASSGDFWLDAYVTDFLSRARASGYTVPQTAFESALDNLSNRVNTASDFDEGGEDIAYALMVLAREGRAALSDLRYFADVKAQAMATPLSSAQLGTALAIYGDVTRSDRLFRQASAQIADAQPEGSSWRADYGTHVRDVAGVLALSHQTQSSVIDRAALAGRLAGAGGRLSTQEQAWMLLAAHEARAALGAASVTVDGRPMSAIQAARYSAGQAPRSISNTGAAPLPLTLTAIGVPEGQTDAGGQGYRINREYYTMDGAPHDGAFEMRARYVTVLTVTPVNTTGARLMVNDPLPAGLEIDNPNLLRSGDLSEMAWLKTANVEHAQFRADRFLAAVDHGGTDSFRLAYIVRAVSPGRFHHPAALVEDMYRPEYRGQTASTRRLVLP